MSSQQQQQGIVNENNNIHVIVIVLGDLGRSPRMQYHALSLLEHGYRVSLVGYSGEAVLEQFGSHERLQVIRIHPSSFIKWKRWFPPIYYLVRMWSLVWNLICAFWTATRHDKVDCVLVQNPPAIPLLFMSFLYCQVMRLLSKKQPSLVIDWHNLGFSMFDSQSTLQKLTKLYEKHMAPLAQGHFCVTSAMKDYLVEEFALPKNQIFVLHDCPPTMFQPLTIQQQHEFFTTNSQLHDEWIRHLPWHKNELGPHQTLFTELKDGTIQPRIQRPALVTSSTSWTPDEDFGTLLEACVQLDERLVVENFANFKLIVIVTGKGPQKEHYEQLISKLMLRHISIQTAWLSFEHYPKLLACADVGVSLHTSTSGLDLPMKVLDLFGCHVPVLARNFQCLSELVQDHVNGRVFDNSQELAQLLDKVLCPLFQNNKVPMPPHGHGELRVYSRNLQQNHKQWNENWNECALPVLQEACAL